MRRLAQTAIILSTLTLVPLALADDKAKPPAELPKPAPALVEAFKGMAGTWACKGKFQKMDGSGEMDSKSTMVMKPALDGFAYAGDYKVEKNGMLPNGMKGQLFWAYDASSNKLIEFFADSYGGVGRGTSDGLSGDTVVWDEDGVMMGKPTKSRTTVKRTGPKELTLTFEMQTDGKWAPLGRDSCKKP
jgi:Protein of unknown function (DUF1579)